MRNPSDLNVEGPVHRFEARLMATTFGIYVAGGDRPYAAEAAREAFEEARHIERELSRYHPASDVARLRAADPGQWIRVGPTMLECLRIAGRLHAETGGAFDVTLGALVDFWRGREEPLDAEQAHELDRHRAHSGMHHLRIDPAEGVVASDVAGLGVDLGGIGKGYALDCMIERLNEWDLSPVLAHGGQSTLRTLGVPKGRRAWPIDLRHPLEQDATLQTVQLPGGRALAGSGTEGHGRHIIDPRTGRPAPSRAAWAAAPGAAHADGLSTAFMVMGPDEVAGYCERQPAHAAMLARSSRPRLEIQSWGNEFQ